MQLFPIFYRNFLLHEKSPFFNTNIIWVRGWYLRRIDIHLVLQTVQQYTKSINQSSSKLYSFYSSATTTTTKGSILTNQHIFGNIFVIWMTRIWVCYLNIYRFSFVNINLILVIKFLNSWIQLTPVQINISTSIDDLRLWLLRDGR